MADKSQLNNKKVICVENNNTGCFERNLNEFFEKYLGDVKNFPWERLENIREWERENPIRLAMLDAISGMVYRELGNDEKACDLWSKVLLSSKTSHAGKTIANAGMAAIYAERGDTEAVKKAVNELYGIGAGYVSNLWTIEALNGMLEIFEERCSFYDETLAMAGGIIDTCRILENEHTGLIKERSALLRANTNFYVASALVTDEELSEAEKLLEGDILPTFTSLGQDVRVADAKTLLCLTYWLGERLDKAIDAAEAAWKIYETNGPMSEKSLSMTRALWDLYYESGDGDAEAKLLDLFEKNGIEEPQSRLDALEKWIGEEETRMRKETAKCLDEH